MLKNKRYDMNLSNRGTLSLIAFFFVLIISLAAGHVTNSQKEFAHFLNLLMGGIFSIAFIVSLMCLLISRKHS